jgi:CRISPR system Cascade subunit CasE
VTVWLARLRLNLRHRDVRRDLRDGVALHRRVMSLLPDGLGEAARQQAGVLYRLDETREQPLLLVQSRLQPDNGKLPERYADFDLRVLDPLLDALRPGTRVHYRIAANASKRLAKADGHAKPGQVVALNGAAAAEWWQKQATSHGLALITSHAVAMPQVRGRRHDGATVCHAVTRFDGLGFVRDAQLLQDATVNGIGRGKSYGCGLLSLAPLHPSP